MSALRFAASVRGVMAAMVLAGTLTASDPVLAASGWIKTHTGVPDTSSATDNGPLPDSEIMHIVVALTLPDAAGLQQRISRIGQPGDALYGTRLTPAQFAAQYAPSVASAQQVVGYLQRCGFTDVQVDPINRLLVTAQAPVAVVNSAFNTVLESFTVQQRSVYANTLPAQVPAALQGLVQSVLGLDTMTRAHTGAVTAASGVATPRAIPLGGLPLAYDAGGLPPASTATVAIFMAGDLSGVSSDFGLAAQQNHLAPPPVTIVEVGAASSDTSNTTEWDLDSQTALAMAGGLQRMVWYNAGSLSNADLLSAFNRWVTDNSAATATASFGECETDAKSSCFLDALDPILMQAAAQGQTLFAASGDQGGNCASQPTSALVAASGVSYPASAPYAVGVGGTTLYTDSAYDYGSESVWINSGGGSSVEEPSPSWQQPVLPPGLLGQGGPTHKGVPDMAMDGDPNSGALIIVNGQPSQVGGTSLSAPLAAGAWARLQTAHGSALGFAAPLLYAQASGPGVAASGFHDITTGSNGSYTATTGWDYASGLGSFDVAALSVLLSRVTAPSPSGGGGNAGGATTNAASQSGGGAMSPGVLVMLVLVAVRRRRRRFSR